MSRDAWPFSGFGNSFSRVNPYTVTWSTQPAPPKPRWLKRENRLHYFDGSSVVGCIYPASSGRWYAAVAGWGPMLDSKRLAKLWVQRMCRPPRGVR